MSYQLLRGDALALPLADDSVDLIVTSPPYFALRSYTDGGEHYDGQIGSESTPQAFLEALWAVTAECVRVLKPSGSLWVNLGDKYAGGGGYSPDSPSNAGNNRHGDGRGGSRSTRTNGRTYGIPAKSLMLLPQRYAIGCIDQLGLICRAEVIWSKPNGLPESVTDRVRRSHEHWFHFTKEPRYFSAVDEVREAYHPDSFGKQPGKLAVERRTGKGRGYIDENRDPNPLGKLPGSVWTVPTEPLRVPDHLGVDHFAAFPSEFPRRLILGWSPSGVCVECGEGRRPVVAKEASGTPRTDHGMGKRHTEEAAAFDIGNKTASARNQWAEGVTATITGYACACPDTSAPTRPRASSSTPSVAPAPCPRSPTPSDATASASTSAATTCASPSGGATTPSCAPRCSVSTPQNRPSKAK